MKVYIKRIKLYKKLLSIFFKDLFSHLRQAKHVSIVLLGNIRLKQTRKINYSTAKEFATARNIMYFESNFMDAEDLDRSFGGIAADMISNLKSLKIRLVAMDPHIDEDNKTCTLM